MRGEKMAITQKNSTFKRLKEIFYETRVLMGRGYTLQRFATEALDGSVDPVMLSYIEKGKRFATEGLVHKLARARGQDPQELLVLLWQDRMIHAFSRELRKVIKVEKGSREEGAKEDGISDAKMAFLVCRGIASLPEDGGWIPLARWKRSMEDAVADVGKNPPPNLIKAVTTILEEQHLIERQKEKIRRLARHYVPSSAEEKRSLALEFCGIFAKGLLEKVVRQDKETYVRNHYLHVPQNRIEEFYGRLDQEIRKVVEEFSIEGETEGEKAGKRFINALVTATPF
jgi:hypothetical protein